MKEQDIILIPDMISGPKVTRRDKFLFALNRIPLWIPVIAAVIIICTSFIVRNVRQIKAASESSMLTRSILPEENSLLNGIYYVKSLDGNENIYSSAEVSSREGFFYITFYSDYSPLNLKATLMSDGTLCCEGLGRGRITFKPSTESVNIVFTKESTEICELSK